MRPTEERPVVPRKEMLLALFADLNPSEHHRQQEVETKFLLFPDDIEERLGKLHARQVFAGELETTSFSIPDIGQDKFSLRVRTYHPTDGTSSSVVATLKSGPEDNGVIKQRTEDEYHYDPRQRGHILEILGKVGLTSSETTVKSRTAYELQVDDNTIQIAIDTLPYVMVDQQPMRYIEVESTTTEILEVFMKKHGEALGLSFDNATGASEKTLRKRARLQELQATAPLAAAARRKTA